MSEQSEAYLQMIVREETFAHGFSSFTADEMRCQCDDIMCGLPIDEPEFKNWCQELQDLRNVLQFPFHVTSWYRCPAYNDSLYNGDGTRLEGPHTIGATDLAIEFERMYRLVDEATSRGMGVGIFQKGPVAGRYIHLDNLGSRIWTY
jgi:uncharacterized protein YcbK (DUF882 family)